MSMELDVVRACDLYRIDITTAVGVAPTLVASFIADVSGTTASFTDSSTPVAWVVAWDWDFGDSSSGSSSQNPTHIYASTGAYSVTLTVTAYDGGTAFVTTVVSV